MPSLLEKGLIAFQNNDFRSAASIWQDALNQTLDDGQKEKLCLNLGIACSQLGEITEAISHYRLAVDYSEKAQNLCVMGRAYMGLGQAYRKFNELDDAIQCSERAIEIFEKLDDPLSREKARVNCGLTYVAVGRTEDSRKSLEEAYQALVGLGRLEEAETILTELAKQKKQ